MNILLALPKIFDEGGFFPIGMAYVASFLRSRSYNVECLNLCFSERSKQYEVLKRCIKEHDIKIVGTGGISAFYPKFKDFIRMVRTIDPRIIIIMGGGIVSSAPELIIKNLPIDFGVIGEGEYTAAELIEAIVNKKDYSAVSGIIYRNPDGGFVKTDARKPIGDLDGLAYPDYKGFQFEHCLDSKLPSTHVFRALGYSRLSLATMSSARSCPFNCTFCFHTSGTTYRQRNIENFFKEVEFLVDTYGVNTIDLCDELFSVDRARMLAFAERAKRLKLKWTCLMRVFPTLDLGLLKYLKECGLIFMNFGLESTSDKILKSMQKKITSEQIKKALQVTYEAKVNFGGNFLFGDPEETMETAMETVQWWGSHPELNTNLGIGSRIITYPGTPIYAQAVSKGLIRDEARYLEEGCSVINIAPRMEESDYKYLSFQLYLYKRDPRHVALGSCVATKVTGFDDGKNIYAISLKCPHCGVISDYEQCWRQGDVRNWIFGATCKNINCCQSYWIFSRDAFRGNRIQWIVSIIIDKIRFLRACLYTRLLYRLLQLKKKQPVEKGK